MKKDEAMPGKYLGKADFPQDTLVTISYVRMEGIKKESGDTKDQPVAYFSSSSNFELDMERGMIVNSGNWDMIEDIAGEDDSDKWGGCQIVVFVDPSIMFGNKTVGGVRIRRPADTSAPAQAKESPPPPPPTAPASDIPF